MRNMKTMNLTKLPYLSIESLIRLIFRFPKRENYAVTVTDYNPDGKFGNYYYG